jgi:glutathione synthase/RimK-type ligase-like ATP-grasp enzyme
MAARGMTVDRVGIMLDWTVLQRGIRGDKSYERLPYYAEICKELGMEPVFFHPRHVRPGGQTVLGHFWNGSRLIPRLVNVPKVIHNRVLSRNGRIRATIRRLSRTRTVFNGLVVRDKWRVHQMLWKNPAIRTYLPHTVLFTPERLRMFLDRYQTVYVKPAIGSVGIGVARIERHNNAYRFIAFRRNRTLSRKRLMAEAARWVGKRRFIIQQGVPLARYQGKTFDIRVSVQKNGNQEWTVSGLVAKVANRANKLSNLARGGRAVPLSRALGPLFTAEQQKEVVERIKRAAVEIARQYQRHFPSLADLGLDMGIDRQGHPYLIEINVRDQRYSFYKAGELAMFKKTYRHPMEYARSLLAGNGRGRQTRP